MDAQRADQVIADLFTTIANNLAGAICAQALSPNRLAVGDKAELSAPHSLCCWGLNWLDSQCLMLNPLCANSKVRSAGLRQQQGVLLQLLCSNGVAACMVTDVFD